MPSPEAPHPANKGNSAALPYRTVTSRSGNGDATWTARKPEDRAVANTGPPQPIPTTIDYPATRPAKPVLRPTTPFHQNGYIAAPRSSSSGHRILSTGNPEEDVQVEAYNYYNPYYQKPDPTKSSSIMEQSQLRMQANALQGEITAYNAYACNNASRKRASDIGVQELRKAEMNAAHGDGPGPGPASRRPQPFAAERPVHESLRDPVSGKTTLHMSAQGQHLPPIQRPLPQETFATSRLGSVAEWYKSAQNYESMTASPRPVVAATPPAASAAMAGPPRSESQETPDHSKSKAVQRANGSLIDSDDETTPEAAKLGEIKPSTPATKQTPSIRCSQAVPPKPRAVTMSSVTREQAGQIHEILKIRGELANTPQALTTDDMNRLLEEVLRGPTQEANKAKSIGEDKITFLFQEIVRRQKPAAQEPGTQKPEAKKPEAKKPEAKKPEVSEEEEITRQFQNNMRSQKPVAQKPEAEDPEKKITRQFQDTMRSQKPVAQKSEAEDPEDKMTRQFQDVMRSMPKSTSSPAKQMEPAEMAEGCATKTCADVRRYYDVMRNYVRAERALLEQNSVEKLAAQGKLKQLVGSVGKPEPATNADQTPSSKAPAVQEVDAPRCPEELLEVLKAKQKCELKKEKKRAEWRRRLVALDADVRQKREELARMKEQPKRRRPSVSKSYEEMLSKSDKMIYTSPPVEDLRAHMSAEASRAEGNESPRTTIGDYENYGVKDPKQDPAEGSHLDELALYDCNVVTSLLGTKKPAEASKAEGVESDYGVKDPNKDAAELPDMNDMAHYDSNIVTSLLDPAKTSIPRKWAHLRPDDDFKDTEEFVKVAEDVEDEEDEEESVGDEYYVVSADDYGEVDGPLPAPVPACGKADASVSDDDEADDSEMEDDVALTYGAECDEDEGLDMEYGEFGLGLGEEYEEPLRDWS